MATKPGQSQGWVHAERLVHKLMPATPEQRRAIEVTRLLIWRFYADLKA